MSALVSAIAGALSALIAIGSLAVAIFQYRLNVIRRKSEVERIAMQRERLRTAYSAAHCGIGAANLIVQRAKAEDVSIPELQNIARAMRGNLTVLAEQLRDEDIHLYSMEGNVAKNTRGLSDHRRDPIDQGEYEDVIDTSVDLRTGRHASSIDWLSLGGGQAIRVADVIASPDAIASPDVEVPASRTFQPSTYVDCETDSITPEKTLFRK